MVVVGWLGKASTALHCTHHGLTCRFKEHHSVFFSLSLLFGIFISLEKFGNCRGRLSNPFLDYGDRDFSSPSFFFVYVATFFCDRL